MTETYFEICIHFLRQSTCKWFFDNIDVNNVFIFIKVVLKIKNSHAV
jgi:hypothetical protein